MALKPGCQSRELEKVVTTVWPTLHVLVVGDVMLDKYIWGEVERISPEAPIPIVRASRQTEQPGGAANVAMNAADLGARVSLAGLVGHDADGELLAARLQSAGIESRLTVARERPTSVKTRILGGRQQMLRVDVESNCAASAMTYQKLLQEVTAVLTGSGSARVAVVILSDYAKGVLNTEVCQAIITRARALGIPVIVDPKGCGYAARYKGATTLCPNLAELALATGTDIHDEEAVLRAGEAMMTGLGCESLTVTLSERGIVALDGSMRHHAPAVARQVFDVSGAGDTVTAVIAMCKASGLATVEALQLANLAAGLVVAKVGTAPVELKEMLSAMAGSCGRGEYEAVRSSISQPKLLNLETMISMVSAWRAQGDRVVFTNGCFDLLHAGHVKLLEEARKQGDRLIVGLNSDASVRRLKGVLRPVVGQADRATMLGALRAVDSVVLYEEETPLQCILALRPDVLVKGSDYSTRRIVGSREVRAWGGLVVLVPVLEERSTTAMIAGVITSAAPAAFSQAKAQV